MKTEKFEFSRRSLLQSAGLAGVAASVYQFAFMDTAQADPSLNAGHQPSMVPGPGPTLSHPGILHRVEDLERMKKAVAAKESPIYDGFLAMAANPRSSYSYAVQNTGQIQSWGRGPSNFTGQTVGDAAASYQNALMWTLTGDRRHADKARDILNAWARSLQSITGADGQLGSGLQGFKFANAAELLRHSGYDGWPEEDFQACVHSLRTVWYESLSGYALFANGNWDDAALQTILAIAILSDDRVMFENGLRFAAYGSGNGSVLNRVVNESGQGQESGRDQPHEQLGQGLLGYCAQVAWNQGVNLFGMADNRILAGYEYNARYNLGFNDVPFVADLDRTGKYFKQTISPTGRGQLRPIYELAYSHYVSRLGLSAPGTSGVVFRGVGGTRVIEGWHEDDPGWGTLTFARTAAPIGMPASVPGLPSGLRASGTGDAVSLSWVGSVDPVSGATSNSYSVKRTENLGGDFTVIASEVPDTKYEDRTARSGHTYYYAVTAANEAGSSEDSAAVAGTTGLPAGWESASIGTTSGAGNAHFDGERFTIEDHGSDIAGNTDSFRFTFTRLPDEGAVIARIVHPLSSQYAKVGVMIRSSLDAGSAHAAMLLQGLPLHTWSGVWTTRATTAGPSQGSGSVPVPPTQQQAITVKAGFPIMDHGSLPESATPLAAPYVEGAGDGYRLRMPYWVRIVRTGKRVTGSISPDGKFWTEVGSTELDLRGDIYAGLASCSCLGDLESGTSTFDNVSVGRWSVPKPGGTAQGLSAASGLSAIELSWSDHDPAARYVVKRSESPAGDYKTIAGDVGPVGFGVRLRYSDPTGVSGRLYYFKVAKTNLSGEGPDTEAVSATMPEAAAPAMGGPAEAFATLGTGFEYRIRSTPPAGRYWARNLPPGLIADDETGAVSGVPRLAGVFESTVGAGSSSSPLRITVGKPLPSPWSSADFGDLVLDERMIGPVGVVAFHVSGVAHEDQGQLVLRGAGPGLNVNNQGMVAHVAHQTVQGDKTITVRIADRTDAASGSRIGVIMSKSLSPFDLMAATVLTPAGVGEFIRRPVVAGRATITAATFGTWVRLSRTGTVFSGAVSGDGITWTNLAEQDLPGFGDAPYFLGLVVCSGSQRLLTRGAFESLEIS
ncbi:alginate lyase family protein [Arthrobacter rhizosphaerae]|uniref:alginate lyase family protein n=1 Tax=Arthrobacter rhizosphaerae TaxID=2855490 RepID=UPI001FF68ADE|nr:alginate lyase family protein [Arthrobacter rhizosphaerae]